MKFQEETYYTFDDVLIEPAFSDINSREDISTEVDFLGLKLQIPIISANMDYVTGSRMANAMWEAGGLGIIHRFCPFSAQMDNFIKVMDHGGAPTLSVGTRDITESMDRISTLYEHWEFRDTEYTPIVCVDVAHGHHKKVAELIKRIKDYLVIKVIAGNVATEEGAYYLAEAGADAIKVGIGPGSVCTTRIVTGIGIPQLSAIGNIADALKPRGIPIIADGGIRNSGDIVKALAAGATTVMLGSLLAGASECPGEVIETGDGRRLRRYQGQSILGVNGEKYTKEGVAGFVSEKGPVANILKQLVGGLRSGISYVGARNIKELQEKAVFIKVSNSTLQENHTRIALSI